MQFSEFVHEFGRTYAPGSTDYAMREALFLKRVESHRRHNCETEAEWKVGVNHLSDWTEAELQGLLGHKSPSRRAESPMIRLNLFRSLRGSPEATNVPNEFSWSNLSSIKETRDQGNCGSCWAMASTTAMSAHAELKGLPRHFSASQIVACTPNPNACGGTGGCGGSTAELAFEYVLRAGVASGDDAFFEMGGVQGGGRTKCPEQAQVATEKATDGIVEADGREVHMLGSVDQDQYAMRGRRIGMVGWAKLPENREDPIVQALVEQGPLYVAVAAGDGWFNYYNGVMSPEGCDRGHVVNHAVVLYGYGIKPHTRIGDVKYWSIKNSWGRSWGEDGSIRLQRLDDEEGSCGWDSSPQEGSGCRGGPPQVWVCGSCGILYDAVVPTFTP
jgi:cathepsin L